MSNQRFVFLVRLLALLPLVALPACGGEGAARPGGAAEEPAVSLGPENVVVVDSGVVEAGPAVSGTLEAERTAAIRAQVSGTVGQVLVEEGQAVSRGAVLLRITAPAVRDAALSARSGVRSAEMALEVARRNHERAGRLAEAGALSDRDLERARWDATSAEAALADARSRQASADEQLGYTEVRAPFDGVVSQRAANLGDVVQPGTSLLTLVDPSAMRLEAALSVEELSDVRVGAPVEFTVSGFGDRRFTGRLDRVNPAVDPATRQVRVYARLPNADRGLVAGLYAEGRVATRSQRGLVIPVAALDGRSTLPAVLALRQGRLEAVPVTLGLRDDARELVEVVAGVSLGDTLLLGTAQGLAPGSRVTVAPVPTGRDDVPPPAPGRP